MQQKKLFSLSPLALAVICAWSVPVQAALHFDPAMLETDSADVADLSRFEQGGSAQPPGKYSVELYVNGNSQGSRELRFVPLADLAVKNNIEVHDSTGLIACLTNKDLADMGVNIEAYATLRDAPADQCISPGHYIPQAFTAFDFQHMRLDISIPQIAMRNTAHGWIAPQQWDEGINAGLLSYQFSGYENRSKQGVNRSQFLNLTSGINVGPWRLRDNSTWSNNESRYNHQQKWQHLNTYVQRAIIPWRSELTAGDSTTENDIFDAFTFRGVHLTTDDSMYPDTLRGFAPEIRGTAMSNAQITVRQHGIIIYRTAVAAGAFVIKDLYPVSTGGDFEVTVNESDGSVRVFTVPFSSVPVLQRQGHVRYALTAGQYRSTDNDVYSQPSFAQATLLWGLPHSITAYGGSQVAKNYLSVAAGAGINMGRWGAVSADLTQANSTLADGTHHQGQSVRFMYGRSLISTGTTVQLAGYRYSTQGFHTLQETAMKGMKGWISSPDEVDASGRPIARSWSNYYNLYNTRRERVEVNLSQNLFSLGSLYLSGSHQSYWNNKATTDSLQAGFSSTIKHVNYTLSYGYSRISGQPSADKTFSLFLSIPLSEWLPQGSSHSITASYGASRNSDGGLTHQAGLSGTLLSEDNLSWGVTQGYSRRYGSSGDLNAAYQGTYGNLSAGYGYSNNFRQLRYGASGGAILHRGGLTLGQPLGTTNVLVAAPGAAGVPLENSTGIHTDWRGYTVVPYASMYRDNRVALDVSKLDDHTDIDNAVSHVVPTRGALVRADFATYSGARVIMNLRHQGKPLPFGTTVAVDGGHHSSLVADDGEVYLSGLPLTGVLKAKWGNSPDQQCSVNYHLPASVLKQALAQAEGECR